MNEKVIKIDSALAVARIGKLLPQWLQWGVDHDPKHLELVVRVHSEKRRLKQNACYWAVVGDIIEQMPGHGFGYVSKKGWDVMFRVEFLGVDSYEVGPPHDKRVLTSPKEHKSLNVQDFSDFLQQTIQWAVDHEIVLMDDTREKIKHAHDDYSGSMGVVSNGAVDGRGGV